MKAKHGKTECLEKRCISNLLEDIQYEYDAVMKENEKLKEENKELNSEMAKDIKVGELNKQIEDLTIRLNHYGMPDYIWDKFEKYRGVFNFPYWDQIIIEELPVATAYTVVYKNYRFTEYC